MLILAALLYKYITNNADGLIMYMLSLAKDFPDAPVVPFFLGSDINEQAHADARLTQYAGRRTNLDAITLVQGMGRVWLGSCFVSDFCPFGTLNFQNGQKLEQTKTEINGQKLLRK